MCGIAGYLRLGGAAPDGGLCRRMTDALARRGPDACGTLFWSGEGFHGGADAACRAALGHRRLSITDPGPASDQPLLARDSGVAVVFNGEIFNHAELREELRGRGRVFRTGGDAEVALAAYEEFGQDFAEKLNGMWALALWDSRSGRLVLSRDRFGIKPLYLRREAGLVAFASEPAGLLPLGPAGPDMGTLASYLSHSFHLRADGEESFYSGIRQVPAAHGLAFGLDGGERRTRYWTLPEDGPRSTLGEGAAAARLLELIDDAVRLRTPEGVPFGLMLSGGLDSGSVASSLRAVFPDLRPRVYTAANANPALDESSRVRATASMLGLEPRFVSLDVPDAVGAMAEVVAAIGEPLPADPAVGAWLVMKAASADGCRVMLTGDGGDEVFAGYHRKLYFLYHLRDLFDAEGFAAAAAETLGACASHGSLWPLGRLLGPLVRGSGPLDPEGWERDWRKREERDSRALLSDDLWSQRPPGDPGSRAPRGGGLRRRLAESLLRDSLPKCLRLLDRVSMAFSIEARPALLDHRLVEFAFSLPVRHLAAGGVCKRVLRTALEGRLPDSCLTALGKGRMLLPDLVPADLRRMEEVVLDGEFGRVCVKRGAVRDLFRAGREDPGRHAIRLWPLASAACWFDSLGR